MACTSIAADTCCHVGSSWASSIEFAAMPSSFKLVTRSYKGNERCQIIVYSWNGNGVGNICRGMGDAPFRQYHGGGYSFINGKKRGGEETCQVRGGACQKSVRPDTSYLKDGQGYGIAGWRRMFFSNWYVDGDVLGEE
jgi:hypothetical protein